MSSPDSTTGDELQGSQLDAGDEFAVIDRLRSRFELGTVRPAGEVWIGDDAAVVTTRPGPQVLATDLVVAGIHVDLSLCGLDDMGYKAVMVTVSDLAAMGARPTHLLVSIAAPAGVDLELVAAGVARAATETGAVVVGGDLSQSAALVISVAVSGGFVDQPGPITAGPLLRSGARPGDTLVVTGPLGASAAGLRLLQLGAVVSPGTPDAALVEAHRRPRARIAEGETARRFGVHAAIDISDGLLADVDHLARASGVGISLEQVPVAPGATESEALAGGEDYELVLATDDPTGVVEAFGRVGLRQPLVVGACTSARSERFLRGHPFAPRGWRHDFTAGSWPT